MRFFPAACLLLLSSVSFAQHNKLGIKAGINLSEMNSSLAGTTTTSDKRTSFQAGFYATIVTSKKFSIQPELLYSEQGNTNSGNELKLNYLLIPLLFRYHVLPKVNVQAGPQLGILLHASDNTGSVMNQFSSMEFAMAFGAGVDLPLRLNLSARYVLGISNLSTVDLATLTGQPGYDLTIKSQVIQVALGFNLSRD